MDYYGRGVQSIQLFDTKTQKQLDEVTVGKAWYGLQFSGDEKFLYASGGNDNVVLQYSIVNNKFRFIDSLKLGAPWPVRISPGGIAIDNKKNLLYVVTKENNSLYVIDIKDKIVSARYDLPAEAYSCLFDPKKNLLYVSC
jgi:DNA-binding beta-propeller fold protein YncE